MNFNFLVCITGHVSKIIPSPARPSSCAASSLPSRLLPLLDEAVEQVKGMISYTYRKIFIGTGRDRIQGCGRSNRRCLLMQGVYCHQTIKLQGLTNRCCFSDRIPRIYRPRSRGCTSNLSACCSWNVGLYPVLTITAGDR